MSLKVRLAAKKKPAGWELVEPTLLQFEERLREAVDDPHEGKRKCESAWPIHRILPSACKLGPRKNHSWCTTCRRRFQSTSPGEPQNHVQGTGSDVPRGSTSAEHHLKMSCSLSTSCSARLVRAVSMTAMHLP